MFENPVPDDRAKVQKRLPFKKLSAEEVQLQNDKANEEARIAREEREEEKRQRKELAEKIGHSLPTGKKQAGKQPGARVWKEKLEEWIKGVPRPGEVLQ